MLAHPVLAPCTPWKSVVVTGLMLFLISLHFSMFFAPVWPYLQIIDPEATETLYGFVVAAYSLGQLCSSPLMAWWSRRYKRVTHPVVCCVVIMFLGNVIYLLAALVPTGARYVILLARFVSGAGESSVSLIRSYTSVASLPKDRAKALAVTSCGLAVGTTVGPVIQLLLNPIGYPGLKLTRKFGLNMYTAPAIVCIAGNVISVILMLCVFEETYAEQQHRHKVDDPLAPKLPNPDKKALGLCYFTRFTQFFVLTNLETIGSSYAMVMFALNKRDAVQYMSMAHVIFGTLAMCTYALFIFGRLDKHVGLRGVCVGGIALLMAFHLVTFSWPFLPTALQTYSDAEYAAYQAGNRSSEPLGCNRDHFGWCDHVHPTNIWLYFLSFGVGIGLAFPVMNVSLTTLMSQVLGPRNQAHEQSIFQMMQSCARLFGPLVISHLYASCGPPIAWLSEIAVIGAALLAWLLLYRRVVPLVVLRIAAKPSYVWTIDDYSDDSLTFEKPNEKDGTSERVYRL